MRSEFSLYTTDYISDVMSLRKPQQKLHKKRLRKPKKVELMEMIQQQKQLKKKR